MGCVTRKCDSMIRWLCQGEVGCLSVIMQCVASNIVSGRKAEIVAGSAVQCMKEEYKTMETFCMKELRR